MTTTTTGSLPIGFRCNAGGWWNDLGQIIDFATSHGFESIDTGAIEVADIQRILDAGLKLGSVDLPQPWADLTSADAGKRRETASQFAAYIRDVAALGPKVFFTAVLVEEAAAERKVNLDRAADGYGQLCQAVADTGVKIVIEGWPGGPPHFATLACTPDGYRTFFDAVDSDVLAVNFDPSHLIRMGIDSVRFLNEFVGRVAHVHAKDTLILPDELYEFGNLQSAVNTPAHMYGENAWRYTIPGHGTAPWRHLLSILKDAHYQGAISIELEDENFPPDSDTLQKKGLLASRDYLIYV